MNWFSIVCGRFDVLHQKYFVCGISFVVAAVCVFVAVVSRLSTAQLTTSSTGKNNHLTRQRDLYYYQTLHLISITRWCYVYEIFFSESISRLYYEWSENVIIFNTFDLHRPWRYPLHRFCWYCKGMHLCYPHYYKIQNHKKYNIILILTGTVSYSSIIFDFLGE